jgi:hypothetical protein
MMLWESYREWLKLTVVHFDAIAILAHYVKQSQLDKITIYTVILLHHHMLLTILSLTWDSEPPPIQRSQICHEFGAKFMTGVTSS